MAKTDDYRTPGFVPPPQGAGDVYAGLITAGDLQVRDDFTAMVSLLRRTCPSSGSDALAMLRSSWPHVPLASRVAAVEAARR